MIFTFWKRNTRQRRRVYRVFVSPRVTSSLTLMYRTRGARCNRRGVRIVNRLPRKNGTGNVVRRGTLQARLTPRAPFGGPRALQSNDGAALATVCNRGFSTARLFRPGSGRVLDPAQRSRCLLGLSTSRSRFPAPSRADRRASAHKPQGKHTGAHRKLAELMLLVG